MANNLLGDTTFRSNIPGWSGAPASARKLLYVGGQWRMFVAVGDGTTANVNVLMPNPAYVPQATAAVHNAPIVNTGLPKK
jgi:hypothetical protein